VCPYIPACVSRDVDLPKRVVQEHIAYYVGGMGTFYHNVISRYGFGDEADRIVEAWKRGSKTQAVQSVSDSMTDSVAIVGTAGQGRKKLEEFRQAGADLPILIFPPKASREMVKETIVELAPET
jgi:alkanesulfonate monooxygenase SsuD/methylene tetrahydromethanopterin reductase-like flavin-dependent oxidoreductase (luciferase family)